MQDILTIRYHPVDLRGHGVTPAGLSLYRVVWADSRTTRLHYEGCVHEMGLYEFQDATRGKWILEKWLPAEKVIGLTREQYEAFMAAQPGAPFEQYPIDGDYELVSIYPGHVDLEMTHAYIAKSEWRLRNVSLAHRKQEVHELAAVKQVENKAAKMKVLEDIAGRDAPKEEVKRVYV